MRPIVLALFVAAWPSLARADEPVPLSASELWNRSVFMSLEEEVRQMVPPRPSRPWPRTLELGILFGDGELAIDGGSEVSGSRYALQGAAHWHRRGFQLGPAVSYDHWAASGVNAEGWTLGVEAQVRYSYPLRVRPFVQLAGGVAYASYDARPAIFIDDETLVPGGHFAWVYQLDLGLITDFGSDHNIFLAYTLRRTYLDADLTHFDSAQNRDVVERGPMRLSTTGWRFGYARRF